MKKFLAHILASAFLLVFLVPAFTHAQNFNLIVCDGVDIPCDFNKLMEMLGNLTNALIALATLVTTIILIYVGFMLVVPSGNVKNMEKAKKMGLSVLKGYLWILGAWLVVYTIFNTLLEDGYQDAFR
jgi:hypothetical protein